MPSLEGLKLWVPLHFSKWELVPHGPGEQASLSEVASASIILFCIAEDLEPRHVQDRLKGKLFSRTQIKRFFLIVNI